MPATPNYDERAIAAACAVGDPDAFEHLVEIAKGAAVS